MIMSGLIVGFTIQNKKSNALNGDGYDDDDAPRRSYYTQVKEFVVGHGKALSSLKDFEDPASPQARAAS